MGARQTSRAKHLVAQVAKARDARLGPVRLHGRAPDLLARDRNDRSMIGFRIRPSPGGRSRQGLGEGLSLRTQLQLAPGASS